MSAVAEVVAPIFALILIGWLARRFGYVSDAGVGALNDFVFYLATPALLFAAVTGAESLDFASVVISYFSMTLLLFALSVPLAMWALKASIPEASVFGLNVTYGNTVMIGIPLIAMAFGQEGLANLIGLIAFHATLLLPVATILMEIGANRSEASIIRTLRATFMALLRNPVVMGIFVGLMWRWAGIPVPSVLKHFTEMLGASSPPMALLCLGASLHGFARMAEAKEAALAGVLKMFVMPAMVAAMAGPVMGLRGVPFAVVVITAALPTGANAFVLARRYATLAERSATTVVICTAASVVTLGLLIAWFR